MFFDERHEGGGQRLRIFPVAADGNLGRSLCEMLIEQGADRKAKKVKLYTLFV